jgi:Rrf2 family protein
MKLNTRARYALRAMIQIARASDTTVPISLTEISKATSVSKRYLEQLVIPLKNASLLKGISGKEGGYLLAKPADQIRIGDIIEASIGPIKIVDCVDDPDYCMKTEWCECRPLYLMLNQRIRDAMNSFTLAELADHKVGEALAKELESTGLDQSLTS